MAIKTNAGSVISVSAGIPATFDETGYAALTWTVVGNVENVPGRGREYVITNFNPVTTRATQKFKGSYDEQDATLTVAYDPDDGGMVILKAGLNLDANYAFKIVDQGGDVTEYFSAQVTGIKRASGDVNAMRMVDVMLAISSVGPNGTGIIEVIA